MASLPGGTSPVLGNTFAEQIARGLKELDPEQIRGIVIPLYGTLGAAATGTAVSSAYDTYRVPTTHDLLIEEIRPYLLVLDYDGLTAIAFDTDVKPGNNMEDRLILMASNCLVDLKNSDREQKVFDNHSLVLASLMKPMGDPLRFGTTPHKVPAGETLRCDVKLQETNTAAGVEVASPAAYYGIVLVGKLVRVARS
jgi:hypothetical protein